MKYVLILSIIALLLFAVFFLRIISPFNERASPTLLTNINKSDLQRIDITNESGKVELKKIDDIWYIEIDGKDNLTFSKYVDLILNLLLTLRPTYTFKPQEPLKDYGLKPAKSNVVLTLDNHKSITLDIGNLAPTGSEIYLTRSGSDNIYMIPYERLDSFVRAVPADFKYRNVLLLEGKDVKNIDIMVSDKRHIISKNDSDITVELLGGEDEGIFKVDEAKFQQLSDSINYLSFKNYIPVEKADIKLFEFALEHPMVEIKVTTDDNTTDQVKFSVYDNHIIYDVDAEKSLIHVLDPDTVNNFLNTLQKVIKTDSEQPNKESPQSHRNYDDIRQQGVAASMGQSLSST